MSDEVEEVPEVAMRDTEETDEEAIERAMKAKASLAARMRAMMEDVPEANGAAEAPAIETELEEPLLVDTETETPVVDDDADELTSFADRLRQATEVAEEVPEEAGPPRGNRVLQWFLGREEQEEGEGDITVIEPVPEGWHEVEFYAVEPPFAFVRIERHEITGELRYRVHEPELNEEEEEVLDFVQEALVRGLNEDPGELDQEERGAYLATAVHQILKDYRIRIDKIGQARVEYFVRRNFLGLGPIHAMMHDPEIEDISCDGPHHNLFVFHRVYETMMTDIKFRDDADLDGYVIRLAQRGGKAISISAPILDAALPDGSRLQATLGKEVTENGSTFTIRRFKPDPFTPVDLMRFGSMSAEQLAWFWLIVEHGLSLIFSGGTASGKTTALNAISQFIPQNSKLVSIEDTREVNLPHKNWIKSVTRAGTTSHGPGEIGMFELLKAALRQRPDYILVGEVRGIEATVAFQAMATGHAVYSTMHADSARSVVYRLENEPINVPRLVLQALDVIAIQAQVRKDGKRVRRVKEIVELVGIDPTSRELLTNKVFEWDPATDTFRFLGRSYMLERIASEKNWGMGRMRQEFDRRVLAMEKLTSLGLRTVEEITSFAKAYSRNPEAAMERLETTHA